MRRQRTPAFLGIEGRVGAGVVSFPCVSMDVLNLGAGGEVRSPNGRDTLLAAVFSSVHAGAGCRTAADPVEA